MLRNEKLYNALTEKIQKEAGSKEKIKSNANMLLKEFDVPIGISTDYMTNRVPVDDASDFVLYTLSKLYLTKAQINSYFTDKEIKYFDKTKFHKDNIHFPIELPMIQIAPDQWIGKITAKQLMEFRDAQIINYNERTQRAMEKKIVHGNEVWQISINDVAVAAIENSYESNTYIPNTLTFNISDESEADYSYNPETKIFTIKKIKAFDIVDGYHRYRGLSKVSIKNKDFDYPMELRITTFMETKAKQFIWQEDQKTKMSKVVSDTYNQTDYAVWVSERLVTTYPGVISRNVGTISFTHLSNAIRYLYDTDKIKNMAQATALFNEIKNKMDVLFSENPNCLDKQWKKSKIYSAICVFKYKDKDFDTSIQKLDKISREKENAEYLWATFFNKRKASSLAKLMKDNKI